MGKGLATAGIWGACAAAVVFSGVPEMGFCFIAAMLGTMFIWG